MREIEGEREVEGAREEGKRDKVRYIKIMSSLTKHFMTIQASTSVKKKFPGKQRKYEKCNHAKW